MQILCSRPGIEPQNSGNFEFVIWNRLQARQHLARSRHAHAATRQFISEMGDRRRREPGELQITDREDFRDIVGVRLVLALRDSSISPSRPSRRTIAAHIVKQCFGVSWGQPARRPLRVRREGKKGSIDASCKGGRGHRGAKPDFQPVGLASAAIISPQVNDCPKSVIDQ